MARLKFEGALIWGFETSDEGPPMHVVRGYGDVALCGEQVDRIVSSAAPMPLCAKCVKLIKKPRRKP